MIDERAWAKRRPGAKQVLAIVGNYRERLEERGQLDFTALEEQFLLELENGGLADWLRPTRVLLVDEYQDTNLLQETIYRRIASHVRANGGWFAIVGDDEQSLFRFRGATVELFVAARQRYRARLRSVPLSLNRRSSEPILGMANRFVALDRSYQAARAAGKKPLIPAPNRAPWRASDSIPVLGLFRPDASALASALGKAISDLLGRGWKIPGGPLTVSQAGDIAVIAPTTQAVTESYGKTTRRVYADLADECARRNILWFNPRGTRLADVPAVQQLLGLVLLCIDHRERHLPAFVWDQAARQFANWRAAAKRLIAADPPPRKPHRLADFVRAWQQRRPQGRIRQWPREFPLMELLHELTVWIPELRQSPGFLYLEGVTRALDQLATLYGPWAILVSRDRWEKSVEHLYNEFFVPVALDDVELDEEVLEVLPLDAVNAVTIYQVKGLEFPVCFVDVGSRFSRRHPRQSFARFPDGAVEAPYTLEDQLRRFSSGLAPPKRSANDRAFDDLVRLFYVAFTRAQHLLVLFGIGTHDDGPKPIENVATGWTRNGKWRFDDLGVVIL
jgi:DNA helicase-2/ATP-dependent DNA helicase PcrA